MNTKTKSVEMRTSSATTDSGALQKGYVGPKCWLCGQQLTREQGGFRTSLLLGIRCRRCYRAPAVGRPVYRDFRNQRCQDPAGRTFGQSYWTNCCKYSCSLYTQDRTNFRVQGKDGKTKFAIENASRTRVVLADQKIHILGGFKNIHIAREAIVSLILGSQPGKVYGNLRTVAGRMKERF